MQGTPLYKLSDDDLREIESSRNLPDGMTLREADQRRSFAKMILCNRAQQKSNPAAFTFPKDRVQS